MLLQTLQTFLTTTIVLTLAFEDILVNGQGAQELIDLGRDQYQLLRERSGLPQYGPCWTTAVDHVDAGCKHLTEDTQSDIALHLTNCFLQMSALETHNCAMDRKPNLRSICINSMSDRAFNVYTQFFTHTQNMCWFLRGQIWQETITDNAFKVGEQLELTAKNQDELIRAQKSSIAAQEKMLRHGQALEKVLEELYVSSKAHQEVLTLLSRSFMQFQAWALGEMSWFDSVLFYTSSAFFIWVGTATRRTESARLVLGLLLLANLIFERVLCYFMLDAGTILNAGFFYLDLYEMVWFLRKCFIFVEFVYLVYFAVKFRDLIVENNRILGVIFEQNCKVLEVVQKLKLPVQNDSMNLVNESFDYGASKKTDFDCNESNSSGFSELKVVKPRILLPKQYNLRSKTKTPEIN